MKPHILILAEQINKTIAPVVYELITAATTLRQQVIPDALVKIIILAPEVSDDLKTLASHFGIDVIAVTSGRRNLSNEQVFKSLPVSLLAGLNPAFICMAHNANGLDIAPALAVSLGAGCITGVEKIFTENGDLYMTRAIFGDRMIARIHPSAPVSVLTIAPGFFKPAVNCGAPPGTVTVFDLPDVDNDYVFIECRRSTADTSGLENADVIVSAGNGFKKQEHLDLVHQLASCFPKSAVTGSRPICDKKWLKYCQQVGITGATVKPKLYIACGISGASQHISGMRESKYIVSINTDPHAAIFNISDICIIEDVTTFLPLLIGLINELPK